MRRLNPKDDLTDSEFLRQIVLPDQEDNRRLREIADHLELIDSEVSEEWE